MVCAAAGRLLDGSNFFHNFFSEGFVAVFILHMCIFASGGLLAISFQELRSHTCQPGHTLAVTNSVCKTPHL